MKAIACGTAVAIAMLCAGQARAQTADEIVEKYLTAIGGRQALGKLESRIQRGTMTASMQGMSFSGPIELYNKAPNKQRMYTRFDLSQVGAGEVVVEARFDGKSGYRINTIQGDREMVGKELDALANTASFPTPFFNYKAAGAKVELTGKDKIGDRAVYVVVTTPKSGPASTNYFDAETYQLLRTVMKIEVPELGGELEQTVDFADYRDVDGLKLPFAWTITDAMQTVSIKFESIEHNKPIDDGMFSKPGAK